MSPNNNHARSRRSLLACAGLSFLVLALNIGMICWSARSASSGDGTSILMRGGCSAVSRANTGAHVLINILGSLLLGASSYSMQIAIAPIRRDIDVAHRRRRWLDIGVPSFRNLLSVSVNRRICWILLVISSLPLHLIYNSSIVMGQVASEYLVTELDERFVRIRAASQLPGLTQKTAGNSGVRPGTGLPEIRRVFDMILKNGSSWDNLTAEACAQVYSKPMLTSHRTLVLVVRRSDAVQTLPGLFHVVGGKTWMCDQPPDVDAPDAVDNNGLAGWPCNPSRAMFGHRSSNSTQWQEPSNTLYCLAEPVAEDCKLEVSIPFLVVVCIGNAIKIATMLRLFYIARGSSINTLGDAVASFLETPDASTRGFWNYDYQQLKELWILRAEPTAIPWYKRQYRRFHSISKRRVVISSLLFSTAIVALGVLLGLAIKADVARGTLSSFSTFAFTDKSQLAIVGFESLANASLASIVILVNTPQLIMSMLYFLYNSLFTSFLQAHEWNSFSLFRQPLRVTKPVGVQQSTYWLQIRPSYAIPLLLFGITMHWLISQSIFLMRVAFLDFAGRPSERFGAGGYGNMYGDHPGQLLAAGYSSISILLCLILACVAIVPLILVGMSRLKGDMILVGSCSAAISAACHLRKQNALLSLSKDGSQTHDDVEEEKEWTLPLKWGAEHDENGLTSTDDIYRHLTFSSGVVQPPTVGRVYSA